MLDLLKEFVPAVTFVVRTIKNYNVFNFGVLSLNCGKLPGSTVSNDHSIIQLNRTAAQKEWYRSSDEVRHEMGT